MQARIANAVCIFVTAAVSLSSCAVNTAQTVNEINDASTFEIALLTHASEIDFSTYQEVPGFGVTGYYDKKYETSDGTPAEECYVLYSVTAYPDHLIGMQYVTSISVTDPNVIVYGYSVGSSADDFQAYLESEGFTLYKNSDRIRRFEKGNVRVRLGVVAETQMMREICVEVKVSNYFGIQF